MRLIKNKKVCIRVEDSGLYLFLVYFQFSIFFFFFFYFYFGKLGLGFRMMSQVTVTCHMSQWKMVEEYERMMLYSMIYIC